MNVEEIMNGLVVVPDGELTSTLLITANLGSIFDDPLRLIPTWTKQIWGKLKRLQPQFVALHCQEIGGKNFAENMINVDKFVTDFVKEGQELGYARVCAFFDKNFAASDKFTALGSIYLVHKTVQYAELYNFEKRSFETFRGHHIRLGCIDDQPFLEKHKFPLYLFPESRWSRKGFLRTRWRINGTVLDLINIHLFHDASNLISVESSIYVNYRKRALQYTLDLIQDDDKPKVPFIMFGDFNFRLDGKRVLEKLTKHVTVKEEEEEEEEVGDREKSREADGVLRQFRNQKDELVLSIGKKEFSLLENHDSTFNHDWKQWSPFDTEVSYVQERVTEFAINFPPTYPFEENPSNSSRYMKTRCPAWCDRVLLSNAARELIHNPPPFTEESYPFSPSPTGGDGLRRKRIEASSVLYDVIGRNACMGDHKPVFLLFNLKSNVRIPITRYPSYGIYEEVPDKNSASSTRNFYPPMGEKGRESSSYPTRKKEETSHFRQQSSSSFMRYQGGQSKQCDSGSLQIQPPSRPGSSCGSLFKENYVLADHKGSHPQDQLTQYVEIKDCNKVKLFKETTV